jgi:hypothetical protein
MSDEQRRVLKESWAAINSEIGQSLCYVSGNRSTEDGKEELFAKKR